MITCNECLDRFKSRGDNPKIKSGRYHLCGCDYCDKSDYYRQLEQPKPELEIPNPIEIRQLRYRVEQARAGFLYLRNKLNEHLDKKRKTDIL